jgi:hypothetical protein
MGKMKRCKKIFISAGTNHFTKLRQARDFNDLEDSVQPFFVFVFVFCFSAYLLSSMVRRREAIGEGTVHYSDGVQI